MTDVEAKEERNKIRRIIDKFDRKAISAFMHEENIALMCISLNELRVEIQRQGVNSIGGERIRELLITIKAEIDEIIIVSLAPRQFYPHDTWKNSILYVRYIGTQLVDVELESYYLGQGRERTKERLALMYEFFLERTRGHFKYARDVDREFLIMDYPEALEESIRRGVDVAEVAETIAK